MSTNISLQEIHVSYDEMTMMERRIILRVANVNNIYFSPKSYSHMRRKKFLDKGNKLTIKGQSALLSIVEHIDMRKKERSKNEET
jgi:hypothetical protein